MHYQHHRVLMTSPCALPETEVKALREKYLTPSNYKFNDPPKFNKELRVLELFRDYASAALNRNKRIEGNQSKTFTALSAAAQAITVFIQRNKYFDALLTLIPEAHIIRSFESTQKRKVPVN